MKLRCLLTLSIIVFSTTSPLLAKQITSPTELGPYDFRSTIGSRLGSVETIVDQSSSASSLEIVNPVIAGVPIEGLFSTDSKMTLHGPSTWISSRLQHSGEVLFTDAVLPEIRSHITFDLAAFGSAQQAQLRIKGSVTNGNEGRNILGLLTVARLTASSTIEIFETDAQGNAGEMIWGWLGAGEVDEEITIDTNALYKVTLTSKSDIVLSNIASFTVSAFSMSSQTFNSATENVEVHVSDYTGDMLIVEAPPRLTTLRSDGLSTGAQISGGATRVDGTTYDGSFSVGESIRILATLEPATQDINKEANVFVVVKWKDELFQLDAETLHPYSGSIEELRPMRQALLRRSTELDLLAPLGGAVTLSDFGLLEVYVGFATDDGVMHFSATPITVDVKN